LQEIANYQQSGLARKLRAYARRHGFSDEEAEDLVQEALVRAIANAETFPCDQNPVAYIYGILRYVLYAAIRQKIRDRNPPHIPANSEKEHYSNKAQALDECLQELSETERWLFHLHCIEGYSQRKIGEILEIPRETVRYRLNRILRKVKECLESKLIPL
jgi:RNA polymerase sigma-70 factor (ECF subfamily)